MQLIYLLGLVLLILWIILPFMVFDLRSRVRRLEEALQGQEQGAPIRAAARAPAASVQTDIAPAFQSAPASSTSSQRSPQGPNAFETWLKEDWLLKLGGLLLLMGFGWLVTYAFMHNWIGPMGRIAFGLVCGTALLVLGTWRIKNYLHQGSVFLVIGSTVILITVFAARQYYSFFTPLTALALMFLSTAYIALVSVYHKNRALSIASIILAGVAPLLTNSGVPDYVGLFAYLLIVVLGTVWVVAATGQREVTLVALIMVALYSLPHLERSVQSQTLLLFAYAFAAIFYITNTVGILKLKDHDKKDILPDIYTAALNGLFLLFWIMNVAPIEWRSLIISGWMVLFIVGAFVIFKATNKYEPFAVYAGVGVAMLAAATSAELHGSSLTIAYTIESAAISLIAYNVLGDRKIGERLTLLLIGPMFLSLQSIASPLWYNTVIHRDFFVLLVLAAVLLGLGVFYWMEQKKATEKIPGHLRGFMLIAGSIYVYILVWQSLHAALSSDDLAVMLSLFVYTVVGLITYFYGRTLGSRNLGLYGGGLLGFVIARLFLVDVWNMAMSGRIITFFVIGILLMSTAFFGKKKK